MLLVFVGGLCLVQALYFFLGKMQIHSSFREHMIVRVIDRFVLQAEALAEDHHVTLPAPTASRLTSLDRAWLAPMSALDVSSLSRVPALEARLHEALAERGVAVVSVEAAYGVRPRRVAETVARQQYFGEWALPSLTQIAARLPGVLQWLNLTIGSHPPPPITPDVLFLDLAIVSVVGGIGVALIVTQNTSACRHVGQAATRVGTYVEGATVPVTGPATTATIPFLVAATTTSFVAVPTKTC